jgi:hypothetical protein
VLDPFNIGNDAPVEPGPGLLQLPLRRLDSGFALGTAAFPTILS